jgi:hypothetical protein
MGRAERTVPCKKEKRKNVNDVLIKVLLKKTSNYSTLTFEIVMGRAERSVSYKKEKRKKKEL